jgi:flagellar motor switch protein FliM
MNFTPPAPAVSQDTVSQSEVERLLAQISGGELGDAGVANRLEIATPDCSPFQRHTFPKLSFFSSNDLRKLRVRHEEFTRSLTARLSISHRLDLALQMSKLETVEFQRFVDGLSNPTFLSQFKLEPLPGICLLDIPPALGLHIVERELGGSASTPEEVRDLSEVESRLLSRVVETILSEWCSFWSDMLDLRPVLLGHESSGRFLDISSPEAAMLVLGMEVGMGEMIEQLQFAFPYHTLERLIVKLNSDTQDDDKPAALPTRLPTWNPFMNDVQIRLTAEFANIQLSARQLAQLKPGDILPLKSDLARHIRINLEEVPKFFATLGTCDQHWAIQILQLAKPANKS